MLATLGLGTTWPGGIALLAAPNRPFLLAASAVCLVSGAVLLWTQRVATVCASDAICSRPAIRGLTLMGLLLGLVLLYLGYAYV